MYKADYYHPLLDTGIPIVLTHCYMTTADPAVGIMGDQIEDTIWEIDWETLISERDVFDMWYAGYYYDKIIFAIHQDDDFEREHIAGVLEYFLKAYHDSEIAVLCY